MKKIPVLSVAGPTLLVSFVLFAACTVTAVFLYRLHARTAEILTEDIDSRRTATEIETTLRNLIALLQGGSDQVDALHERLHTLLEDAHELANTEEEETLESELADSFTRYSSLWQQREGDPKAVRDAQAILEKETLPKALRLRNYNNQQIEKSEDALRKTVKWIAWALVVAGIVGSLGGVVLGYGVARALRQSIYKLSVRIQDAADKLGHELPTVTIAEGEGFDYLHDQMHRLVREIEQVVARLQQRDREVRRAEQLAAVGQLAAGVAHELRNPLTAVKMLVQTSREDMERRGFPAEDLSIIEQEIRRLESTLQTFLNFARPPKMERRMVHLAAIVDEALALLSGRARKQNVFLDFNPPETPVLLQADGEQLRQLLVNLGLNALDEMPRGGSLKITVACPEASVVEVHVQDSGPGVAPELLPRLFEPFVSGKETGLGLGLVVSRRIAEDHGGTLEAVPMKTGGCFVLRLPLAATGDSPGREALPAERSESVATAHQATLATRL